MVRTPSPHVHTLREGHVRTEWPRQQTKKRALARNKILLAPGPQASRTVRNTLHLSKAPCLQFAAEASKLTEIDGISIKNKIPV